MLILDLGVLRPQQHEIEMRESLRLSLCMTLGLLAVGVILSLLKPVPQAGVLIV